MDGVVAFTAWKRPHYLFETLQSWQRARGFDQWQFEFALEPSELLPVLQAIVSDLPTQARVTVNPVRYGQNHNPYTAFDRGFQSADFVVLAEDDAVVSTDVLEFFVHCRDAYRDDPSVLLVSTGDGDGQADPAAIYRSSTFTTHVWATWRDRWEQYLGPTWDHDYSTYDEVPGHHAGFDWQVKRVIRSTGKCAVMPQAARSNNIGQYDGVHQLPEQFEENRSPNFVYGREPVAYREQ